MSTGDSEHQRQSSNIHMRLWYKDRLEVPNQILKLLGKLSTSFLCIDFGLLGVLEASVGTCMLAMESTSLN